MIGMGEDKSSQQASEEIDSEKIQSEQMTLDGDLEQSSEAPLNTEDDREVTSNTKAPDWKAIAEALQEQVLDFENQKLRALAEVENIRRQAAKDRDSASKFAIQSFASSLLDVADNVERALMAISADARENKDVMPLVVGLEMIAKSFRSTFDKNGISRIETIGSAFDPNFHQAMQEIEDAEKQPGTIAAEFQAGYSLNGRLLRPAMVSVVKAVSMTEHVDKTA